MRFKKTFPFSLTVFTGQGESLRKTIFWWFETYTDFDTSNLTIFNPDSLNESQRKLMSNVINTKIPPRKTLLQIVNAGPGTGKTTAANALAYSLREEGVLLISYTNESIRENYKRFFEYSDGKNISGLKKYTGKTPPLINLVTVDSLAAHIIGDSSDTNFDRFIQMAAINIDPQKFVHPLRKRIYNHIVVDECQDIDDLRGNFILTFCRKVGVKTLSLFGDPRQKIRGNAGKWYSDLWEDSFDYVKNGHSPETFSLNVKIGFEKTYRFRNESIIELVNSLSSQRQSLHVKLQSGFPIDSTIVKPIEILPLNLLFKENFMENLLPTLGSMCIIGPSIDADNKTTNVGRRIASAFRENGMNISFKSEGAFVPDAIPFLTIHSVKGREFDTVFLFGMSNYPHSFSMIPLEEALSLIFVAHSRARSKIYYIDSSPMGDFVLPLHVPPSMVNVESYQGTVQESHSDFEKINSAKMRHFDVTGLVEDHTFLRFIEENRYMIHRDPNPHKIPDWKSLPKPKEISSMSWGFLLGFDYGLQLTSYEKTFDHYFGSLLSDDYVVFSLDEIVKRQLEGSIVNNYCNGKRVLHRELSKEDQKLIKALCKKTDDVSYDEIIYLYEKYFSMDNTSRNLDFYRDVFQHIKGNLIEGEGLTGAIKGGNIENSVSDRDFGVLHGRIDYLDKDLNVYEMKSTTASSKEFTSLLQTWLYYVMNGESESFAYILDLQKGYLYELSSNESIFRWKYLIRCYFILRHHVDLVTARRNYLLNYGKDIQKDKIQSVQIKENFFTVDTEFYGGKDIFEIALVNVSDPYRTIVDLLLPSCLDGMMFALDWLPHTVSEMYKSKIENVKTSFNLNVGKFKEAPTLSYYVCPVDVDWCNRKDLRKIDLSLEARRSSESQGAFTGGSFGPKLGELYTILAPFPLEYQSHLQAHTALSDSLMLYELVKLGLIKIGDT